MYTFIEVRLMLGERLQDIRKDHGDTQQALADKLHVSLYICSLLGAREK